MPCSNANSIPANTNSILKNKKYQRQREIKSSKTNKMKIQIQQSLTSNSKGSSRISSNTVPIEPAKAVGGSCKKHELRLAAHVFIFLSLSVSLSLSLPSSFSFCFLSLSLSLVYVCGYVGICVYLRMCARVHACMCVFVCVYVCESISVRV